MTSRWARTVGAALLVGWAGCATTGDGDPDVGPAPILESGDLTGCRYERIGTVTATGRSGVMPESDAELRLAIGSRARRLGGDAVIEYRAVRVGTGGGRGGTRAATETRATGVAIRFVGTGCPTW